MKSLSVPSCLDRRRRPPGWWRRRALEHEHLRARLRVGRARAEYPQREREHQCPQPASPHCLVSPPVEHHDFPFSVTVCVSAGAPVMRSVNLARTDDLVRARALLHGRRRLQRHRRATLVTAVERLLGKRARLQLQLAGGGAIDGHRQRAARNALAAHVDLEAPAAQRGQRPAALRGARPRAPRTASAPSSTEPAGPASRAPRAPGP